VDIPAAESGQQGRRGADAPAFLYGHSSGGPPAMRAALQLRQALAEGRRADAVALFMRFAGTHAEQVDGMRRTPFWPGTEAVAPTLAYDRAAILGEPWSVPAELAARILVPALVMAGDASLPFLPDAGVSMAGSRRRWGRVPRRTEPGRPVSPPASRPTAG